MLATASSSSPRGRGLDDSDDEGARGVPPAALERRYRASYVTHLESAPAPAPPPAYLQKCLNVPAPGAGLRNLGNTCFANAVLQCLTHTGPLAQLCIDDKLQPPKNKAAWLVQKLQGHIVSALDASGSVVAPSPIMGKLQKISRTFRLGDQEDAHEFWVKLSELIEDNLADLKKPTDARSYKDYHYQIFGGVLQSQILCLDDSKYVSNTFNAFVDLSLELAPSCRSIEDALTHFTESETLEGDNAYKIEKLNKYVSAQKRLSIFSAPNVLVLHLKRFDFLRARSGKIDRHIAFEDTLDLSPYLSEGNKDTRPLYELYAVLVHLGHSLYSGHYIAFVKTADGQWYEMDDSAVRAVGAADVLRQRAYMLFYRRRLCKEQAPPPPPLESSLGQRNSEPNNERRSEESDDHSSASSRSASGKRKWWQKLLPFL